jgi:hypothetical protein
VSVHKRYHFTKYLPLWTRGEVTISPLGGLRATNHVLRWRQRRGDTLLWPLCTVSIDTVHKGFWAVSSETPPSANPVPSREGTEFSTHEWEHSQKLAVKRYNFTCMPRGNTAVNWYSNTRGTEVPLWES